jgi:hypothetical protein
MVRNGLIVLLIVLGLSVPVAVAEKYRHKSEAEIARLTPAQRVDEWVNEQVYHRYNVSDEQHDLLLKYVRDDGLKASPRIIEIMNEYDPTRFREGQGRKGERFDACWLMLGYIDVGTVRLRGSEEGLRAMDALERAIERMRKAGYGQENQHEWEQHGRFELASSTLRDAKKINRKDRAVRETLRLEYKVTLSEGELLASSNFMVARYPEHPAWSEMKLIKDPVLRNKAGYPLQFYVLKSPGPFYEAYLEFRKVNR